MIEAMAGADAIRNPAEVNTTEKADIVNMRRMRARRRLGDEEATESLSDRASEIYLTTCSERYILRFELYSFRRIAFDGIVSKAFREVLWMGLLEVLAPIQPIRRAIIREDIFIVACRGEKVNF